MDPFPFVWDWRSNSCKISFPSTTESFHTMPTYAQETGTCLYHEFDSHGKQNIYQIWSICSHEHNVVAPICRETAQLIVPASWTKVHNVSAYVNRSSGAPPFSAAEKQIVNLLCCPTKEYHTSPRRGSRNDKFLVRSRNDIQNLLMIHIKTRSILQIRSK